MSTRIIVGDPSEQGTHFWFMVIQVPNPAGYFQGSYQGTRTPPEGMTRLDLFNALHAEIERIDPRAVGGSVIAFDVQPNTI